jgi:hypothetical protein
VIWQVIATTAKWDIMANFALRNVHITVKTIIAL